jgi:hypothetical protein
MTRNIITIAAVSMFSLFAGATAHADLIIELGPSNLQPAENLLFNEEGLIAEGTTVQGRTNNTSEIFDLTGHEELVTPAAGQARVDATADSELDYLLIDALREIVYFTEFEANLHVSGQISGTFTVTACNQFGVCESSTFDLGSGENFFSVASVDGQLIDTVQIQSTAEVDDIRQIRLGGVQEAAANPTQVPEPGTMGLLTTGLIALAAFSRRRRS